MPERRRVFLSYHHANDEAYRTDFERRFVNELGLFESGSVEIGDFGPGTPTDTITREIRDGYLANSSVTIVLVGRQTWQRKHVDWEIAASLRDTDKNPRSGLLGLLLPTHPSYGSVSVDGQLLPRRLHDNVPPRWDYGLLRTWSTNARDLDAWVQEAYRRRRTHQPNNSRVLMGRNWTGDRWTD